MFRFFRSIRQGLMNENKTGKYLKYAVGEFVLIVLGILVALQINNWNERRLLEKQREELIEALTLDFQSNVEGLDNAIVGVERRYQNVLKILKTASGEGEILSVAELKSITRGALSGFVPFRPALGSYNMALSTGSIGLINNQSLSRLFSYHEDLIVRFRDMTGIMREENISGNNFYLSQQLGSGTALFDSDDFTPDRYSLSDEEYLEFLARKDVYSVFEARYYYMGRIHGNLLNLKKLSEEILTALEEL